MAVALPPLHLHRQNAAYLSLAVLITLIVAIIGWSWLSYQTYQQKLHHNQTKLQQRLDKANANQQLESKAVGDYLDLLDADLNNLAQELPDPPHLANLILLSSDQQHQLDAIKAAYHQLDQQLQTSAQLASYQAQIQPILATLQQGQGSTANQQQDLSETWHQAHQNLANIIVPAPSQNFSQKLLSTVSQISQDLLMLSKLYQSSNQQSFLNLKDELATKFDTFDQLAADHQTIVKQQDQRLKQSLKSLLQAY